MNGIKIIVEKGGELSEQSMKEVHSLWESVFSSPRKPAKVVNPGNIKAFVDDTFFMIKNDNNELLSAGRLRPVKINFLEKIYSIEGIADIASGVRGKGYGKILMVAMKEYLIDNNKTAVGFCTRENSPFYEKCGYEIAPDTVKRFVYSEGEKKVDEDTLYLNDQGLMKAVMDNPKEIIFIPVPHW